MVTKKETETQLFVREVTISQEDLKSIFEDSGVTIANANQIFTIILRKTSITGDDRDRLIGEILPGESILAQFKEIVGPTEL
jgi:hypothetical protein